MYFHVLRPQALFLRLDNKNKMLEKIKMNKYLELETK